MTRAHRIRRPALVLGLLAVMAIAAAPAFAAPAGVSIVDLTYDPASITVAPGDTVTWTVTKSAGAPHSVTSGKPGDADAGKLFDSGIDGLKDDGQTFQHTFESAGTFAYFCTVHGAAMSGTVIVAASGEPAHEGGGGIAPERKLLAGGILFISIVLMFGMAWVWRRMNPA